MGVQERVSEHRRRMRERGYRPVQIWVPDVRSEDFDTEAARQSRLIAGRDLERDDQAFIEAVASPWDDE